MFLKKFDYISPEITLFYRGDDRHSSIPSGIISIVFLILILGVTIFVSLDFLLKRNPTAFYYHKYTDDLGVYYLNASNFFHFIAFDFLGEYQLETLDLKSFIIIGHGISDKVFVLNNNPNEIDHYIYELCDKSDASDFYEFMDDDVKNNFRKSFCIRKFYDSKTQTIINSNDKNFKYPYLQHGAKRSDNIIYGIYIQRCKNISDYNDNNCNDLETIENHLFNLNTYSIFFADSIADVNDYKKPIKYIFPKVSNTNNIISYTANHLNFNPLEISSHSGIIFDETTIINSYIYDYTEKLVVEDSGNGIHGSFHFWLQNQVECYDRTYKKIQDISGSIDGLVEIMMFLIEIVNSIVFHDYKILSDFNNEIEKAVERVKSSNNLNKILSTSFYNGNQSFKDNNTNNNNNKNNLTPNSLNIRRMSSKKESKKSNQAIRIITYNKNFLTNSSNIPSSNNEKEELNNVKNLIERKNTLNKRTTKLEKKWKKIKWTQLFCRFRQPCLMSKYVTFIQTKREDIISEEMIIKFYLSIKKIKDFLIINYDNNNFDENNIYNNTNDNKKGNLAEIEMLKEEDEIESINLDDIENSFRKSKKLRKKTKSNNFNL